MKKIKIDVIMILTLLTTNQMINQSRTSYTKQSFYQFASQYNSYTIQINR